MMAPRVPGKLRSACSQCASEVACVARRCARSGKNDVLVSAATATSIQSRTSFSASPGTTKDARKIGRSLFPVHRKATVSCSAASKV
jgi:hypothetical protein